jgi:hypothetical protein
VVPVAVEDRRRIAHLRWRLRAVEHAQEELRQGRWPEHLSNMQFDWEFEVEDGNDLSTVELDTETLLALLQEQCDELRGKIDRLTRLLPTVMRGARVIGQRSCPGEVHQRRAAPRGRERRSRAVARASSRGGDSGDPDLGEDSEGDPSSGGAIVGARRRAAS